MLAHIKRMPMRARTGARQRGVYGLMFALLLIPLIAIVGGALDVARMMQYQSDLQNAVDSAALAGAAVFTSNTATSEAAAQTAATNYFNRAILPISVSVTAPTVTTNANGTLNPALSSNPAYTVTVTASAVVKNTLFALLVPTVTISATGTAGDPVVAPQLLFSQPNSRACDTNTAYLYAVPLNADGVGYNYAADAQPVFNSTNYYFIGSSNASVTAPAGQVLPTFSANQPLGIALVNTTNGNTSSCGGVTGANSYGSPNGGSQIFYSSNLANGQSPSEDSSQSYPVSITSSNTTTTTVTSKNGNSSTTTSTSSTITGATITPQHVNGATTSTTLTYGPGGNYPVPTTDNTMAYYVGEASCTVVSTGTPSKPVVSTNTSTRGSTTTTTTTSTSTQTVSYTCKEQYRQQAGNPSSYQSNCSLYVQTNVSTSYINGLSNSSSTPSAAVGNCFTTSGGGSVAYAAPSCAQLSALANDGSAPAAVFWWDDAGGEGPGEASYGPISHCSGMTSSDPGYGEDCQYQNNFFAVSCTTTGGTTSGNTEVVLTQ